jgi:hypothetical protein
MMLDQADRVWIDRCIHAALEHHAGGICAALAPLYQRLDEIAKALQVVIDRQDAQSGKLIELIGRVNQALLALEQIGERLPADPPDLRQNEPWRESLRGDDDADV